MSRIWKESRQKGSALLLMLAMADFADDDGGNIFPSLKTLADKTRLSTRQVTRLVQSIEEDGELEVDRQKNRANRYRILFVGGDNLSSPISGSDKMSSAYAKGDRMSRSTRHGSPVVLDIAMSPDSPVTIIEPPPPGGGPVKELAEAIEKVCQVTGRKYHKAIVDTVIALTTVDPPYSADEVRAFGHWWWEWPKRQSPPGLDTLRERIGIVRERNMNGNKPTGPSYREVEE